MSSTGRITRNKRGVDIPGILSRGKNQERVRGDDQLRRRRKTIQAWSVHLDAAAIARHHRIDPMVVHVAVEYLEPRASAWEGHAVSTHRGLVQTEHDDQIATHTF